MIQYIPGLKGFSKGSIVFDASRGTWMVIDEGPSGFERKINEQFNILAKQSFRKSTSSLPTGLQTWHINEKTCNESRLLKLSTVCKVLQEMLLNSRYLNIFSYSVMILSSHAMMDNA